MALKKNNMERKSKNGGFKMKGHTLPGINQMKTAKMADGRAKSSAFQKVVKGGTKETVDVSGGDKPERHSDKFDRVRSTKGSDATKTAKLASEYGGTWSRGKDKDGNVLFLNQDGKNVKQVAIEQGQKKSQERRNYIAANTTKK